MKLTSKTFLVTCALLSGCATTYKDFRVSDVNYKEGVAIGRVNITYNQKNYNSECAVCLYQTNGTGGPCQKLTEEGFVFLDILKGENSLGRVECKDTSIYHYNPVKAIFTQNEGVTYFGDVKIDWQNQGGFKGTDMFGLVGALISEAQTYGTFKMTVNEGNMKEVIKAYENQTKQEKVQVTKNLITVGK